MTFSTARGRAALIGPLALFFFSAQGFARDVNVAQIPNGANFRCLSCHGEGNPGPLNAFGRQAIAHLDGRNLDWSALCDLDADGDGYSNGDELGDPDCVWTVGQTPAGPALSHPAEAASVPGQQPLDFNMPAPPVDQGLPPPDRGGLDRGPDAPPIDAAAGDAGPVRDGAAKADRGGPAVVSLDEGCASAPGPGPALPGVLMVAVIALARRRRR